MSRGDDIERGVVRWLSTRRRGAWVPGSQIVGCVLLDDDDEPIVEVPDGPDGWRILGGLSRAGLIRTRVRMLAGSGKPRPRREFRAPES